MEKTRGKIKDLVDVRRYDRIANFWLDPGKTLENYHFTEGLAGLMAKWLTEVSGSSRDGKCRAIAGYRGVGKSHFLSVLAALAANPELRTRVTDQFVAGGAQQLLRRHYPVLNIRRGTQATLLAELIEAVKEQFEIVSADTGSNFPEVLQKARARSGDLPLIIIVDTAIDRTGRVQRNDGADLAEIAALSKTNGIFLGIALDDDIAGADGDNVAISASFDIDYLDQEHLQRAVNAKVFVKENRKLAELRAIYDSIRNTINGFRWSEERFSSLYPLHPVSLEITPFVRRYFPSFSILDFASASGDKIMSRPADSLLGLEDLFDHTEQELRKNEELERTFAAYDSVRESVIEKMPTLERHKVRLILKALFMLSLDGTGTTAKEVGAALMLAEASDDRIIQIERILETFALANDGISVDSSNLSAKTFALQSGLDKESSELQRWIAEQPDTVFELAFFWAVGEFHPEFANVRERTNGRISVDVSLDWRGTERRGVILFGTAGDELPERKEDLDIEWEAHFGFGQNDLTFEPDAFPAKVVWRTEAFSDDDRKVLLGAYALRNDAEIRASFGENLVTTEHAHIESSRRIIDRAIIENASLHIEGFDYNFSEQARNSPDLSSMLAVMFEPIFEVRFFDHPHFEEMLSPERVEQIIRVVFSSSDELSGEDELLGRRYCVPLGLAINENERTRRASKDELRANPIIAGLLRLIDSGSGQPVSINSAGRELGTPPLGLGREARCLVLAAMTSNGLIELVTQEGNRINGRSLDLKIDWNKVAAIAAPREGIASDETILKWAKAITESEEITSLREGSNRSKVIASLVDIANGYDLSKKHSLSDPWYDYTNDTKVWRHSNRVSENYELIVGSVNEALGGSIELEACLSQISTAFGDRTDLFQQAKHSAATLEMSSKFRAESERAKEYVGRVGFTDDPNIESSKKELTDLFEEFAVDASDQTARNIRHTFEKFRRFYSELYIAEHSQHSLDAVGAAEMRGLSSTEDAKRLEMCLSLPSIREKYEPRLRELRRSADALLCKLDPSAFLEASPYCICSFQLGDGDEIERSVTELKATIQEIFEEFDNFIPDGESNADLLTL